MTPSLQNLLLIAILPVALASSTLAGEPNLGVAPTFAITEVKTTDFPYAKDAEKSFILSVKVTKQSSGDIDPSKVWVQVFFYDRVDHQEIKPSRTFAAQGEWLKGRRAKPDWRQKNPETLTVYYTRFKSAKPPSRDYLGYRVLVYYDNRLQDQRADPPNLSTVFPASPFAVPPSYSDALKALARNDYASAVSLLQKPVEQGYAPSQTQLASLYAQGKGVPRDYGKALELYQKAMDQGFQPRVLNDFAWFLATCPDASQRNGKQVVDYASERVHSHTGKLPV
jgi:TPR repeat protein